MLGYINDKKDYYTGNLIDYNIKRAVGRSGGTEKHYLLFKHLLTYSIFNRTLNAPIHDTRAAQACIFLYPINIRVFLSLVLYKEELNLIEEYSTYDLDLDLVHPNLQIAFSRVVSRAYQSQRLYQALSNVNDSVVLTDDYLSDFKLLFNLNKKVNLDSNNIEENIERVFNAFNSRSSFNRKFISVAYNNNRMDAIVALTNALNYKPFSTNLLLQTAERWLLETSNT